MLWKVCSALVLCAATASPTWAQFQRIAKSQPDEFFTGIGKAYIPYGEQTPEDVGQPKSNYDYVWSMTVDRSKIWLGTGANVAAIGAAQVALGSGTVSPVLSVSPGGVPYRVWEFGESQFPVVPEELRDFFGDWRPPKVYQYDAANGQFVDRTPNDRLMNFTLGLRSAGSHRGVTILAGPSLLQVGICLFAFDSQTGEFLGSKYMGQYSNIRRWILANGELYTTALNTVQTRVRGSVLRWTGSRTSPFDFEMVGELDNEGAYLAQHNGRLFVGTWSSFSFLPFLVGDRPEIPPQAGIWMSPLLVKGGLTRRDAQRWTKVWEPDEYEPDPGVIGGYSIGAMESYGGYLYWGTLHYPGAGTKYFQAHYGFPPPAPTANTTRKPIILRANFGARGTPQAELLYGDATVPTFVPNGSGSGQWVTTPNRTGSAGIYGGSAFGNTNNYYAWSSAVHKGRLYFGTFDVSGVSNADEVADGNFIPGTGADLWMFPSTEQPAQLINGEGCGNMLNHGVRNMVSTPWGLFLGTANSSNLLTDPSDNIPEGGWEFLKLIE